MCCAGAPISEMDHANMFPGASCFFSKASVSWSNDPTLVIFYIAVVRDAQIAQGAPPLCLQGTIIWKQLSVQ